MLAVAIGTAGCASLPRGGRDPHDPFERFNRSMYRLNRAFDRTVLEPVAQASHRAPAPLWGALRNFVSNITYPLTIVNDFLQGNVHDGTNDIARLVVNTLFGLGGLFDPATHMDLERNYEDFGVTLGKWGVPGGPYLVLPLLGPSTVRDTLAAVPAAYAYLTIPPLPAGLGIYGGEMISTREAMLPTDRTLRSAYDPYVVVRSAYLQQRQFLVNPVVEASISPPGLDGGHVHGRSKEASAPATAAAVGTGGGTAHRDMSR